MKTSILITLLLFSSCSATKEIAKEQVKTKHDQETILTSKENNRQSDKAYEQIKTGITDNTETIVIETHYSTPDSISGSQYKVSERRTLRRNNTISQTEVNRTEIRDNTTIKNEQESTKTDMKTTKNTEKKEIIQKNLVQKFGLYLTVAVCFTLIFALYRTLK